MSICSYCQKDKKLTFEHLYSDAVLRAFDDVAPLTIDPNREKVYSADPGQNDLCGDCNSGLSPADSYMGQFAKSILTKSIVLGTRFTFDVALTELWVLKTAANLERSSNKNALTPWWHGYRDYLRGLASKPARADVFFAAWKDISPVAGINPVTPLASHEAVILSEHLPAKLVNEKLERAWAMKIGHGVFTAVSWKEGQEIDAIRNPIKEELKQWGWLTIGLDDLVTKIPFNMTTSACFQVISNPQDPLAYKKVADIKRN